MKKMFLVIFLLFPFAVQGQSEKSSPLVPIIKTTGAFFALSVADMNESVHWYKEKLGLETLMEMPKKNKVAVTVLHGGGLIVELLQHDDAMPLNKVSSQVKDVFLLHGMFKGGIIVDDFDNTLDMLKKRNVKIFLGPFPANGNQKANFLVKDNSGNLIQFFGK